MNTEFSFSPEIKDRITVLVVEDNLLNQKLDSFILNNWGLKHEICSNGLKAIQRLQQKSFDVILMDIQMPELNGYDATRFIREELKLTTPVIGITAHATAGEKEKCLLIGMNNYISKPINEAELHELFSVYLSLSHSSETAETAELKV